MVAVVVVVVGLAAWLVWPKATKAPTTNTAGSVNNAISNLNTPVTIPTTVFSTVDLPDRDPNFSFAISLPSTWLVEYRSPLTAINVYDPNISASSNLMKSRLLIQYYTGADFRAPKNISGRVTSLTVAGQPAQRYTLKSSAASTLGSYPNWWWEARTVTEVRSGATSPHTFYVFHVAPDVSQSVIDQLWPSLQVGQLDQNTNTLNHASAV